MLSARSIDYLGVDSDVLLKFKVWRLRVMQGTILAVQ